MNVLTGAINDNLSIQKKNLARSQRGGFMIELNKENADRLLRHMKEDKPNPKALKTLQRGRKILAKMKELQEVKNAK